MGIRVLVISDYRAETSARPEAEIFLALQRQGFSITVMTWGSSAYAEKFRAGGIRVIDWHPAGRFNLRAVRRIREEIVNGGHQVVHLFNSPAMTNGIPAAYGTKVKVVLYRGYTGNIRWCDPSMLFKYMNPRVDRIVCLVEAIRGLFLRNLVPARKLVTINKGHDQNWYQDIRPDGLEGLSIPQDALKIVCAANVRPMKGIRYLLEAMALLPPDAKIHLLLLGHGMDSPRFLRIMERSPLRRNIHLMGYRPDALGVVKACDVFVLSSIRGEAITKAVIEAMSLGVAPLITDIPGNEGLVVDGVCGLVVRPKDPRALADAVLRYEKDRSLVRRFGDAGRQHIASRFHIRETVRQFRALYGELAGESGEA